MLEDDSQSLPDDHGNRQGAAKSETSLAASSLRWGAVRSKVLSLCGRTKHVIDRGEPKGERVETLDPAAPFDWEHHSLSVNLFKTKVGLYKVKQPDSPPSSAPMIMDVLDTALGIDRSRHDESWSRELFSWWEVKVWEDPGRARNPEARLPKSHLTDRLIRLPSNVTAPLSDYVADAPDNGWEKTFIRWAVFGLEKTFDRLQDLGVQVSESAKVSVSEAAEAVSRRALTHPETHGGSWPRQHKSVQNLATACDVQWNQALTFTLHKSKGYQVDYNATAETTAKVPIPICTVHECLGFIGEDDFRLGSADLGVADPNEACDPSPTIT